jgi:hypothetical protein
MAINYRVRPLSRALDTACDNSLAERLETLLSDLDDIIVALCITVNNSLIFTHHAVL